MKQQTLAIVHQPQQFLSPDFTVSKEIEPKLGDNAKDNISINNNSEKK